MVVRNPALIIGFLGQSSSRNGRSISSNNRHLLLNWDSLLGSSGRTFGTLASLASAFGLWEEGLDPGLVDKVEGADEGSEEEEIQKDATNLVSFDRLERMQ